MATLTERPPQVRRRPAIVRVAGTSLAAVVAVAGIAWAGFTSVYTPFQPGSHGAPRSESMKPVHDGVERTRWIVTGPTGGTGVMAWSIHNAGPFPVTLLDEGYEEEVDDPVVVRWAPFSSPRDNLMGGHPDEVRPLPVTIPADEEITLWVTVTRPPCVPDNGLAGGGFVAITSIPLRWSILGRTRLYEWSLDDPDSHTQPIYLCYPDEALQHLER
ncbi:hypothetical protein [Tenggerimyces flavus]|uniref:Uncharacterized protein n=1 Tax=Tenggerimyces flavus TaxID=1708749 RepID=A0ABV7YL11_9ACTN|nr:hypothetical protein [Tenggerimyces flavus]MBM7789695.1 hypothetical protein [Tenggerimyces flavus]